MAGPSIRKRVSAQSLVRPRTPLSQLEFSIWRKLQPVADQHLLVAVSGGRDSVALVEILHRMQERLGVRLTLAHVHHGAFLDGDSDNSVLTSTVSTHANYRDRAADFVSHLALSKNMAVLHRKALRPLPSQSEAELRKFRLSALREMQLEAGADWITVAHHADDLMETRLIRLIRGTGAQGLAAMHEMQAPWLRPLLGFSAQDLGAYAIERKLNWIQDPSNQDPVYLRNWLRNTWLPMLEQRRPGAASTMARSLDLLAQAQAFVPETKVANSALLEIVSISGILRPDFALLAPESKAKCLASYLRLIRSRDYSSRHIKEIIKRLDTSRKRLTFKVANLQWEINAKQIVAVPLSNVIT